MNEGTKGSAKGTKDQWLYELWVKNTAQLIDSILFDTGGAPEPKRIWHDPRYFCEGIYQSAKAAARAAEALQAAGGATRIIYRRAYSWENPKKGPIGIDTAAVLLDRGTGAIKKAIELGYLPRPARLPARTTQYLRLSDLVRLAGIAQDNQELRETLTAADEEEDGREWVQVTGNTPEEVLSYANRQCGCTYGDVRLKEGDFL